MQNIQMFVNDLTVIDFSYLHPLRGIIGESWSVDLVLEGALDDEGMLMDFGNVKKKIKQVIDNTVDHSFVVPTKLQGLEIFDEGRHLKFKSENFEEIEYKAPLEATTYIETKVITKDAVSDFLCQKIREVVPKNVENITLQLHSEIIDGAFYHYSHGLKKHDGNCQRIVHGHRSRIIVEKNHMRNRLIENEIANLFKDIYIGTQEDVKESFVKNSINYICFSYKSSQGEFFLSLPQSHCYLMQQDTTVENIALHLAKSFAPKHQESHIKIKAFEGFKKGAISSLSHSDS